jgi:hypothetical protein
MQVYAQRPGVLAQQKLDHQGEFIEVNVVACGKRRDGTMNEAGGDRCKAWQIGHVKESVLVLLM